MNNNLEFLDIITILSFIIGVENLELNERQVNNLEKHLAEQDHILIEEQNSMLKIIIEQNEQIISLLKGQKHA